MPRRITANPAILGGKPVVDGTRMSVEQILGLIANGMTPTTIAEAWPALTEEDVRAAVVWAPAALRNDVVLDGA